MNNKKGGLSTQKPTGKSNDLSRLLDDVDSDVNENCLYGDGGERWTVNLHDDLLHEIGMFQTLYKMQNGRKVTNRILATEAIKLLFKKIRDGDDDLPFVQKRPHRKFKSELI